MCTKSVSNKQAIGRTIGISYSFPTKIFNDVLTDPNCNFILTSQNFLFAHKMKLKIGLLQLSKIQKFATNIFFIFP